MPISPWIAWRETQPAAGMRRAIARETLSWPMGATSPSQRKDLSTFEYAFPGSCSRGDHSVVGRTSWTGFLTCAYGYIRFTLTSSSYHAICYCYFLLGIVEYNGRVFCKTLNASITWPATFYWLCPRTREILADYYTSKLGLAISQSDCDNLCRCRLNGLNCSLCKHSRLSRELDVVSLVGMRPFACIFAPLHLIFLGTVS